MSIKACNELNILSTLTLRSTRDQPCAAPFERTMIKVVTDCPKTANTIFGVADFRRDQMKRKGSRLFVYPLPFPYIDLSHRIILALQNLPLPYPQMLWCSPNATSSSTDNQISWSLFKKSVLRFRGCEGWEESHTTGFGESNTIETCLGSRLGARIQGDRSPAINLPIVLIGLHSHYSRVMDPRIFGHVPDLASRERERYRFPRSVRLEVHPAEG